MTSNHRGNRGRTGIIFRLQPASAFVRRLQFLSDSRRADAFEALMPVSGIPVTRTRQRGVCSFTLSRRRGIGDFG